MGVFELGINPIRSVRESKGLSLRKAAREIGCHYQLLHMTEHAMYRTVPPVVLAWAVQTADVPADQVKCAYVEYRLYIRCQSIEKHSLGTLSLDSLGVPGDHPIVKLRQYLGLSQYAFCKALCIPVALLYKAENSSHLPRQLRKEFESLGVPYRVIGEIQDRYDVIGI